MSLYSMTGYGRGVATSNKVSVQIELKSLNNRYLELRSKLPKIFSAWEPNLRATLARLLKRGSVDISIMYQILDSDLFHPLNEAALKAYASEIQAIAGRLNISSGLNLTDILRLPGALTTEDSVSFAEKDKQEVFALLDHALGKAIEELKQMRAGEGKAIYAILQRELSAIFERETIIRGLAPSINEKLQQKLRSRIETLLKENSISLDETRLLQEVAFYTDRGDVMEELDRLRTHAQKFKELLEAPEPIAVGKQLDFLVQEMLRETNTIGSKTDDIRVTNYVMELKLAIDRIREQVQNLE